MKSSIDRCKIIKNYIKQSLNNSRFLKNSNYIYLKMYYKIKKKTLQRVLMSRSKIASLHNRLRETQCQQKRNTPN